MNIRRRMAETTPKMYTEQRFENLRGTLARSGMTIPTTISIKMNPNKI